ncbi:class I SAM-dependent methyltransferase [Tunturiibacter gelidoferens]|nr:class I SAM-dependent methyltransferase [Edaphobacter lichenicola]
MKHTERFTGRVEDYERYRLRYPTKVIEILTDHCGLQREHMVADIGAGTGMLAELFLENGNAVVAIEPNDDMRAACEQLATAWPGLTVKKATAENTVLADASVDFISVGRAWHWVDRERAVREFRRILRPAGWVVLASNRRSQDESAEAEAYEKILMRFGRDYRETHQQIRRMAEVAPLFAEGAVVRQEVSGEQVQTLDEFLGQTQSFSATPKPGDEGYMGMQVALEDFFARFEHDGLLHTGTICSVMACQGNGRSGS